MDHLSGLGASRPGWRVGAAGVRITVAAGDTAAAEVERWLNRYLTGWWSVESTDASPVDVLAEADPRLVARLAGLTRTGRVVATWMGGLGRRVDDDDVVVVAEERRGLAFAHHLGRRLVVVAAADPARLGRAAMRLVRAVVQARLEAEGWRVVHAAALAHQGRAVVALGNKGAGKTAVVLTAARTGRVAVLGNDRLLVAPDAAGRAVPWPSSLNLGLGLAAALGWTQALHGLALRGAPYRQHADVTRALAAGHSEPQFGPDGRERKCQVYPEQLETLGLTRTGWATVAAVVLPRVDLASARSRVRSLHNAPVGVDHLIPAPGTTDPYADFLELGPRRTTGETGPVPPRLGSAPAFELSIGRDPDEVGRAVDRVLAGG